MSKLSFMIQKWCFLFISVMCLAPLQNLRAGTLTNAPRGPLLFMIENSLLQDFQVHYRMSPHWLRHYKTGKKIAAQPVEVRLRYPRRNQWHKLTFIQRKFAYGVRDARKEKGRFAFSFRLSSLKEKRIFVRLHNEKWRAFIKIRGKMRRLKHIFVYATGKSYWPDVHYIKLLLWDGAQERWFYERINRGE